jgi:lipopolysaccharide/colanic/teichoic acid biosynthesis glycosyltransferase
LPEILPEAVFRKLVNRERARSDRSGRPFSVVVIHLLETRLARLYAVPSLILSCTRETDDIGWFGDEEVSVLLPETDRVGADLTAVKVRDAFDKAGCAAAIRHYTYQPLCESPDVCGRVHCGGDCTSHGHARGEMIVAGSEDSAPDGPTGFRDPGADAPRGLSRMFLSPPPFWKRLMDVLGAGVLLILLSPLMIGAAIMVRLSSPGPIIFRQKRAGLGGKPFWFYKFRTMYIDAEQRKQELMHLNEAQGPVFKIANDPRVTPIGRNLRRMSIDELPQLWNVLKGDMSLVGPRPPTMDEIDKYTPWQRRRLEVQGGLTCIWQVSGRCLIPFEEWMRMDLRYSRKISPINDLSLLFKTVGAVLSRRGAK